MRKPVLTIFYQFNPWNTTIGGIQTLIGTFIKYAPQEFEVRLVGTGDDLSQGIGKWEEAEYAGKLIKFLALFQLQNDNVRNLIPTTVKYTSALFGRNLASDFMHFHRLEPTLLTKKWQGEKTLFIHNDIQSQITAKGAKNAILWRYFPSAYFALEKTLVGQFEHILSCNTDATRLYQQRYPQISDRINYVKNSFDEEIFFPLNEENRQVGRRELAQKLGLTEKTRFILFAGRLHPQKDPVLLVRAFAALNQADIHLLIAGEGELAASVRNEIQCLDLENRVTMLGAVAQKELAQLHRVSSVFVLSSIYEGLPLVALEALASGTPVVTTKTGETPNLLTQNTGVVCSERTPESLADGLRQVLLSPESYSDSECDRIATPYAAGTVMGEIYRDMLQRWEQRIFQKNIVVSN